MAWTFYEETDNEAYIKSATKMSKRSCELSSEYAHLDTYAALLYKGGAYKDAEKIANKALKKAKSENISEEEYKGTMDLLEKIKAKLK
jgi:hypothetical protein